MRAQKVTMLEKVITRILSQVNLFVHSVVDCRDEKSLVSVALLCILFPTISSASVQSLYVRDGDPLRFVWEVRGRRNMGIICEGKLRASCFVIGTAYKGISLNQYQRPEDRPQSVQELAQVLDLHQEELPEDLIAIWRGSVNWQYFDSEGCYPIRDVTPKGPYHLVNGRARLYPLCSATITPTR